MSNANLVNEIQPVELELPSPLRAYQWEGSSFLVRSRSALLADDMGLGKTVQAAIALRLALQLKDCDRALVVTPASLKLNWERELARWAPNLLVRRVEGPSENRAALYLLPIPVLIASYEQIRTDAASLDSRTHFDVVVIDEAQRIKNSASTTAFACRLLPRTRAWALTGTPVENKVHDLVSIFGFLKLGLLYKGMTRAEIHERMQPYFLRRRKKEVLGELPPIIVQDLPLELQGKQKAAYDALWESRKSIARAGGVPVSEANLLALITRLKQLCNFDALSEESIKSDALTVILESLSGPRDKVLIFSQYVKTLRWLSERHVDFPHDLYHGQQTERTRDKVLSAFDKEPGPRALLVSLKAGGVGLNLQAASTVVLFDRWWNPAVENQAIQRSHRFGRDRPLHVFRFLVTNSIEERIASVIQEKRTLFERYIEMADSAVVKVFSRNELRRILDMSEAEVCEPEVDA